METSIRPSQLPTAVARSTTAIRAWHRLALVGILLLAVFLHFFRLAQEGYANLYYAAAVKSMLTGWDDFFFASFDSAGFVTVDKPPLGLWVQTASAAIFGFNGFSLMLPQALAGALSVLLLYHLVKRAFGSTAGLVAALVLMVPPSAWPPTATTRRIACWSFFFCWRPGPSSAPSRQAACAGRRRARPAHSDAGVGFHPRTVWRARRPALRGA